MLHPLKMHLTAPFCPKKTPFLVQGLATCTRKSCQNERAKMKESRQNASEIRVQDDTIAERTNVNISINIYKFPISCCLHAKPKDTKKARATFCIS